MIPVPENEPIPSIAELNRDMEPYIIQSVYPRCPKFKDTFSQLQFVHFADVHWHQEHWDRIMEYINTYSDTIQFAIHAGDYCGTTQQNYIDLYAEGIKCVRPVLNCLGNHDSYDEMQGKLCTDPAPAHALCFKYKDSWDASFMDCEHSMSYFKDFPEANVRLIVLDCYYHQEEQLVWLEKLLDDALEKGIHVITVSHEPSHPLPDRLDVTFQTLVDVHSIVAPKKEYEFDHLIADFKKKGGMHICNLAGHEHSNYFARTEHGVLNSIVERAASWKCNWSDANRIRGTRTYDSFNVVAIDTNMKLLKLIKIGNNTDLYLRTKKVLCWDYENEKVIFNG